MYRIPYEKLTVFSKKWSLWMWSLARREQFSFQMKPRTSQQTWNRLRALAQSCTEFLTIMGTRDLMDNTLRHSGQRKWLHHFTTKIWPLGPKRFFLNIDQKFICIFFLFFCFVCVCVCVCGWKFWNLESVKTLLGPLTFKCKAWILLYETFGATVVLPQQSK